MEKYTFKIDINNAASYNKLMKTLPTSYYRLSSNQEGGHTLYSHNNQPIPINDLEKLELVWDSEINKMTLHYDRSALTINDDEVTIGQEDFIDSSHENITLLKSETEKLASLYTIPGHRDFGIQFPINDDIYNTLNFIDFYNENDPVLQSIMQKTNGLYFTIEDSNQSNSRNAYISHQDGSILYKYEDCPYRFSLYPYYYRLHDLEIREELETKIQTLEEKLDHVTKMPGPKGELGLKGDPGSKGDKGSQGPIGPDGIRGEFGPRGEKGEQGNRGPDGISGESGPRGEKGNIGDTGPQGPRGYSGEQGPIGLNGTQGLPGPRGESGLRGEKGEQGNRGQDGIRGESGLRGEKGNIGDTGPQGPRGYSGEQGPQGFNGTQGLPGSKGDPGPKGAPGEKGIQGLKGEDGIGAEAAHQLVDTVNNAKFEIINIQKTVEIDKNTVENATKKVQSSESQVTKLHKQTEILTKKTEEFKNRAIQSQKNTDTYRKQVQEMFCTIKPDNPNCLTYNPTRQTKVFKNFNTSPMLNKASRSTLSKLDDTICPATRKKRAIDNFDIPPIENAVSISTALQPYDSTYHATRGKREIDNFDIPPMENAVSISTALQPYDSNCPATRGKREIDDFPPMTNKASRPTSFISQIVTFFPSFIEEDQYKIENTIQELNQTAKMVDTVHIVKNFEKVLRETASTCGIARKSLSFDPIELHSAIINKSFNDDNELLEFLCLAAKKSCLQCKQIDKFLATFKDSMQRTLANNEQHQISFSNSEKIVGNKQPMSFINNIISLRNISEISQIVAGYLR